jgi:hypothetical protein
MLLEGRLLSSQGPESGLFHERVEIILQRTTKLTVLKVQGSKFVFVGNDFLGSITA